jgi:Domain of unknown function (DUF4864)
MNQYELFAQARASGSAPGGPSGRRWPRRLVTLAFAGLVAFAGTVWGLVRMESRGNREDATREAAAVVAQHLAALKRGDLETAYGQFSERYRHEVPFEAFHDLVVTHWAMFRAREVKFDPGEEWSNRVMLRTHILASDGQNYEADYMLKQIRGHWWIDDVHWGLEPRRGESMKARARPPVELTPAQLRS